MCMIALFTALIAISAQLSIPMPFGVPMTMQTLAVSLAGMILGAKRGFFAALAYLLLGAVGAPVFSNFSGGIYMIFGRTGGFILSFPVMTLIIGICADSGEKWLVPIGLIAGAAVNFAAGALMFMLIAEVNFTAAFTACVLPFIPTAFIKAALAWIIGVQVRKRVKLTGAKRKS